MLTCSSKKGSFCRYRSRNYVILSKTNPKRPKTQCFLVPIERPEKRASRLTCTSKQSVTLVKQLQHLMYGSFNTTWHFKHLFTSSLVNWPSTKRETPQNIPAKVCKCLHFNKSIGHKPSSRTAIFQHTHVFQSRRLGREGICITDSVTTLITAAKETPQAQGKKILSFPPCLIYGMFLAFLAVSAYPIVCFSSTKKFRNPGKESKGTTSNVREFFLDIWAMPRELVQKIRNLIPLRQEFLLGYNCFNTC